MLNFFRKYQRYFFIAITAMIVISFAFFGTSSSFLPTQDKVPDKVIGKTISGSPMMQQEVIGMSRFLSEQRQARAANLLDDGVIASDFLRSGLAEMLVDVYFEELRADLETRFEKIAAFRAYAHPQAPALNAEVIWSRFMPKLAEHLAAARQKKGHVDKGAFSLLAQLYLDENQFPPEMLARILGFQQSQYKLPMDPMLRVESLALFGFQNLEDWFGPRFVEMVSQFVINASLYAEQKGYRISREEAKGALLQNLSLGLQERNPKEALTAQDINQALRQQLYVLGLDERAAVEIWRKVLLFRRLSEEVSKQVVLDPAVFASAADAVTVDEYELPRAVRPQSFYDMLKLQVYLDAVAPNAYKSKGFCLKLPQQFLSPAEVEREYPELVHRKFVLEYAHTTKEHLAQNISLKETWDWQVIDEHWQELKKQFSVLAKVQAAGREERFTALEAIAVEKRFEIDRFTRNKIVDAHPEWIEEALAKATMEKRTVSIPFKGNLAPFEDIEDSEAFIAELDRSKELARYTADGKTFYKIRVLESLPEKGIFSYEEANQKGILTTLLDKSLEELHMDARKKDPKAFQQIDGSWKSFTEVKNEIGAYVYASLLKTIATESLKKEKMSLEEYAPLRFGAHLKEVKEQIALDPEHSSWVQTGAAEAVADSPLRAIVLTDQWKMTKTRKTLKTAECPSPEIRSLATGGWSAVVGASFFQLIEKTSLESAKQEAMDRAKGQLAAKARQELMQELLKEITTKNAIVSIKRPND